VKPVGAAAKRQRGAARHGPDGERTRKPRKPAEKTGGERTKKSRPGQPEDAPVAQAGADEPGPDSEAGAA
jgi:hypothetical protein